MAIPTGVDFHVKISLFHRRFRKGTFHALVQHRDDRADHLKVAKLFGGDVEEHILAPGIDFGQPLGEIAHGCCQFAVWSAKLLK
ncbi:hypothetical protein NS277_07665 [Novosphingobium barchaimii]|nr:hypothetical protein NS277_07665 [Novosphingobium barchaimii]